MRNAESILSKFSLFDIKRLLRAKRLHAARTSVQRRVHSLTAKLEDASRSLEKIDRRLARLLKRTGRGLGHGPGRPPGRPARRARRKGSLRSYLTEALRKTAGGSATARELAELALKAGYRTKSKFAVFLRAVNQALHVNKEFGKAGKGKYTLQK